MLQENCKKAELFQLLKQEEQFWHQKSRMAWLQQGDANTRFFHDAVNHRRRRNKITSIEVGTNVISDQKSIFEAFHNHFQELFGGDLASGDPLSMDRIGQFISHADNQSLLCAITHDEIRAAVMTTNCNSAAGLDGFNYQFYQANWDLIKDDLVVVVGDFFAKGRLVRKSNRSHLVFIPKVQGNINIENYRPIALNNCIVKILSRT